MNTAAIPQIEYHVETECGRNFCRSANDLEHLKRDLAYYCYDVKRIQLWSEYEAEQEQLRALQKRLSELGAA